MMYAKEPRKNEMGGWLLCRKALIVKRKITNICKLFVLLVLIGNGGIPRRLLW